MSCESCKNEIAWRTCRTIWALSGQLANRSIEVHSSNHPHTHAHKHTQTHTHMHTHTHPHIAKTLYFPILTYNFHIMLATHKPTHPGGSGQFNQLFVQLNGVNKNAGIYLSFSNFCPLFPVYISLWANQWQKKLTFSPKYSLHNFL